MKHRAIQSILFTIGIVFFVSTIFLAGPAWAQQSQVFPTDSLCSSEKAAPYAAPAKAKAQELGIQLAGSNFLGCDQGQRDTLPPDLTGYDGVIFYNISGTGLVNTINLPQTPQSFMVGVLQSGGGSSIYLDFKGASNLGLYIEITGGGSSVRIANASPGTSYEYVLAPGAGGSNVDINGQIIQPGKGKVPGSPSLPQKLLSSLVISPQEYFLGQTVAGSVTVSNTSASSIISSFSIELYKDSTLFWQRQIDNVSINPGAQTFSLDDVFGFQPTIPNDASFVGNWKLTVKNKNNPDDAVSQTFSIKIPQLSLTLAVDPKEYKLGETLRGGGTVTNPNSVPVSASFKAELLQGRTSRWSRELNSITIPSGASQFTLQDIFGGEPKIPDDTSYIGNWKLVITQIGTSVAVEAGFGIKGVDVAPPVSNISRVWFSPTYWNNDFANLYKNPEQWASARSKIDVYQFYEGSQAEQYKDVVQVIDLFTKEGKPIAIEGAKALYGECNSAQNAIEFSRAHIKSAQDRGATLKYVAMDHPLSNYIWAKLGDCGDNRSIDKIASIVAEYVKGIKKDYPNIQIGGIESPYVYPPVSVKKSFVPEIKEYISALESKGVRLAFLRLDITNYPDLAPAMFVEDLKGLKSWLDERSIVLDIIFGNQGQDYPDLTDKLYFEKTIQEIKDVKATIGTPKQFIFQSWTTDLKDGRGMPNNLPENNPSIYSHTRLVNEGLAILGGDVVPPSAGISVNVDASTIGRDISKLKKGFNDLTWNKAPSSAYKRYGNEIGYDKALTAVYFWPDLKEPAQNVQRSMMPLEATLKQLREAGNADIMLVLIGIPREFSSAPTNTLWPNNDGGCIPGWAGVPVAVDKLATWKQYMKNWIELAKKYDVKYYQIFAEPEFSKLINGTWYGCYWSGSADELLVAYQQFVEAIRDGYEGTIPSDVKVGAAGLFQYSGSVRGSEPIVKMLSKFAKEKNLPLDFFSWHQYQTNPIEPKISVPLIRSELDKNGFTKAELIVSEYDQFFDWQNPAGPSAVWKTHQRAALLGADFIGMAQSGINRQMMWVFSSASLFGDPEGQYAGLFGIEPGVTKPEFNLYKAISKMGDMMIGVDSQPSAVSDYVLATKSSDKVSVMMVNYNNAAVSGLKLNVKNIPSSFTSYTKYIIDATRSNAYQVEEKIKARMDQSRKDALIAAEKSFKDYLLAKGYPASSVETALEMLRKYLANPNDATVVAWLNSLTAQQKQDVTEAFAQAQTMYQKIINLVADEINNWPEVKLYSETKTVTIPATGNYQETITLEPNALQVIVLGKGSISAKNSFFASLGNLLQAFTNLFNFKRAGF